MGPSVFSLSNCSNFPSSPKVGPDKNRISLKVSENLSVHTEIGKGRKTDPAKEKERTEAAGMEDGYQN